MNGTHLALIDKSHVAIDVFIFVNVCTQHLLKEVDLSVCNSCCLFVHTCFVKFATIYIALHAGQASMDFGSIPHTTVYLGF